MEKGNVVFDGTGEDEDFGQEQVTGNPADRYKFRSSPLRNIALQKAFFHNGAFTRLDDAIEQHLHPVESALRFSAMQSGLDRDLTSRLGPVAAVLARLDPLLANPPHLTPDEFQNLVAFLRTGLLDSRAGAHKLCSLFPSTYRAAWPLCASSNARTDAHGKVA